MSKSPQNVMLATATERSDYAKYSKSSRMELMKIAAARSTARMISAVKLGLGKENLIQEIMEDDG